MCCSEHVNSLQALSKGHPCQAKMVRVVEYLIITTRAIIIPAVEQSV